MDRGRRNMMLMATSRVGGCGLHFEHVIDPGAARQAITGTYAVPAPPPPPLLRRVA